MRIHHSTLVITLFASLAVGQINPVPQPDASSGQSQHHRHEDDEEALPASAKTVPPESPVITIKGVCQPNGNTQSGQPTTEGSPAGQQKQNSSPSDKGCETAVTKTQFEELVEALNPDMSGMVRRRLALSYPRLLLFAQKARELGLDRDPHFAEVMQFASLQILSQNLNRYFEKQASNISDADVEKYYNENAVKFEKAELLRVFVPKQGKDESKAGSEGNSEKTMLGLAEKLRARAATGEDFQQLQKEAFAAAHISSGTPTVSTGKIPVTRLPVTQQKIFEMQAGQVSDVLVDSTGYYIYKMVSKEQMPLGQASKQIRKSISSQRVQELLDSLTKTLKFDLNPTYFGADFTRSTEQNLSSMENNGVPK